MAAVNRHLKNKRILLKDVTGSKTITHHSSSSVTTMTTSTLIDGNVFDVDADLSNIAPVSSPPQPSLQSSLPSSTIHPFFQSSGHKPSTGISSSSTLTPCMDIPANVRCKCGQYKFNQACSGKLCQKCCGNSMGHCSVTSHIRCKPLGYQSTKSKSTLTPILVSDDYLVKSYKRESRAGV